MIEIFVVDDQGKMRMVDDLRENCWVNICKPTNDECDWLYTRLGIHEDYVAAALDDEEHSHIDDDPIDGQTLIIIDAPYKESAAETLDKSITQYDTHPLSILLLPRKGLIVTVSNRPCEIIESLKTGSLRPKGMLKMRQPELLLDMLYLVSQRYLAALRHIDRQYKVFEASLRRDMKNADLIKMLGLEKSLVYFQTSLNSLTTVLLKLSGGRIVHFNESDLDLLEDVRVEVRQAVEMCDIARRIMDGSMEAFSSVISNNMNITMRRLTVVTLVLAMPTMVFSFYGMNTQVLPLDSHWIFPCIISAICSFVAGMVFVRSKFFK